MNHPIKKITAVLLALIFSTGIQAQQEKGVRFESVTLEQALNKAASNKKGPRMVFVDCYTTWCGPCRHMANNIFPKEEAGAFFNAHFVNIKIDMEKGEGPALAKKFGVAAYPTFLILDSRGNETGRVVGGDELAPFIEKVKKAMDPGNSPAVMKAAYEENKTAASAAAYLKALENSYMRREIVTFMNENFGDFKDGDKLSEELWKYVSLCLPEKDSPVLAYIVENKSEADARIGKERVDNALISAYKNILFSYLCGRVELTPAETAAIAGNLQLLIDKDIVAIYYIRLAKLYSENKPEEIVRLYDARSLLYNCTETERQQLERAFAGMKGITAENITEYYTQKEQACQQQGESCKGWMEMFLKAK